MKMSNSFKIPLIILAEEIICTLGYLLYLYLHL